MGDATEIPEVAPEKRGSLWNACYATAFWEAMRARPLLHGMPTEHQREQTVGWARIAKQSADLAVFLLTKADAESAQ